MRSLVIYCIAILLLTTNCSLLNREKLAKNKDEQSTAVADSIPNAYENSDSSLILVEDPTNLVQPERSPKSYMQLNELAMIDEINLLRADPIAYIQYIDEYLQYINSNSTLSTEEKRLIFQASDDLIRQLEVQPPLSSLRAAESLYKVAKQQGANIQIQAMLTSNGPDATTTPEQIADSTRFVGVENIVTGTDDVRQTVIKCLIDLDGTPLRNQRNNLLHADWTKVVCYAVGQVGTSRNVWLQLFAQEDPNEAGMDTLTVKIESMGDVDTEQEEKLMDNTPVADYSSNISEPSEGAIDGGEKATPTVDQNNTNASASAEGNYSFMSLEEKAMIDEINLLRQAPKDYIPLVKRYVEEMKQAATGDLISLDQAANELVKQLNTISTLSRLLPHQELYDVAKAHGLSNKQNQQLEHTGIDGRSSFDRVTAAGLKLSIKSDGTVVPNENLVGGESTVRNTVIALLLDDGVPNRGHRRALLEPDWKYVACYKIGTIYNLKDLGGKGNMDHCWVQLFAL